MKKLLIIALGSSLLSSCFLHNIPTIETYKGVPFHRAEAAENFNKTERSIRSMDEVEIKRAFGTQTLPEFAVKSKSNAFLVFKQGKLLFEHYEKPLEVQSQHAAFSVAKSMLSALVGIAIEEGKIKSDSDRVINYLPFLDSTEFNEVKIYHLLQMTSGIRYSEKDIFYSENSKELFTDLKLKYATGEKHEYWSTSYQLLGYVLQTAIAPQTISSYLEQKIWQPMGAQFPADWTIEAESKVEKTFCCVQATAIDFAKFGMLYLNDGRANDKQLIPQPWIEKSIAINEEEGSKKKYNYGWWFFSETSDQFLARGFRGQYIYVDRKNETVIVRFGADWSGILTKKWADVFSQISEQL